MGVGSHSARVVLAAVVLAVGAWISVATAAMAQTIGVVVDDTLEQAIVFDGDTLAVLGTVTLPGGAVTAGDVVILPDQSKAFVSRFQTTNSVVVIDLTQSPPVLAGGVNPISTSTQGLDLTLSADGQFLIIGDGSAAASPLTVIDVNTHAIVGTLSPDTDRDSVESCKTNDTVLMTASGSGNSRRLTINGAGGLVDTGTFLGLGAGQPNNVVCAPDGNSGVAIRRGLGSLQSFLLPGMTPVTDQPLPGSGLGISLIFNAAGDRVFARRGTSGVTAYAYDQGTGTIGAQQWTQAITGRPTFFGMDQIALHPNQLDLFVTIAGQVLRLDAATGAQTGAFNVGNPTGIGFVTGEPGATLGNGTLTYATIEPCIQSGTELVATLTFENTSDQVTAVDAELTGTFSNLIGIGNCSATTGTCSTSATGLTWNGDVAPLEVVTINYRVQVPGGTRAGTELCTNVELEWGEPDARRSIQFSGCTIADCPATVNPNVALSGQVHLPILNFQGQNDACRSWLEVQNIGDEFSKAALVVWGEPGFCPPQCAGPLKVECSGLLKPGSTWNFMSPTQVPNGSKSGILFSFTARQLSQIGVDLGFDDIVADVLCETLFFGVVGDCDDYRRFKKAYNEGLEFAGIPLNRAVGSPLAVEVLRHCPGDQTPGAEVSSKYAGIAGIDLGRYDPVFGGYAYYVPLLYAQSAEFNSIMYIQNGGLECSSVEIWFKAQDDCLRARICEIFTLAPGETYQFDANDCVGPDFVGNAWLRSSQPMGIAVDIFGRDVLMTYVGVPTELNYTFDPNSALETTGNQVAYGPLIYSEYQGWDTGVQVQNMSSVTAAKVKVYFLDRSGDVITTLVDWICPRGSQTYFLPVVADLPGNWVGSLRVESQEWFSPGDPLVAPPNITGIATMIKYSDAARTGTEEALAYNLLVEARAYDWQLGCCGGGLDSGIGLIAIPSVLKDLDNTGVTAELAIANLVPKPGFTDFAIYIYDQNGLIDYVCQKLNEKQVEYIDFDSWGYVNSGFKGSAIISAVFWEHDMFDDEGIFVRNLLGLAAVVVERTATRLGEDIPGDEAAGTAGIPFLQTDDEDFEYFFDFEGPVAPICPGQPGFRQPPGQCPDTAVMACQDCPFAIPDVTTVSSTIDINASDIPAACPIEDVDVLLNFTHTFNSDLTLDLSSPDLADVQLFSAICGATDGMQTILDDEAQQPIGTVCPPTGFQRYNTETPGNLTLFEGSGTNGAWRLDVADLVGGDAGQMLNWELQFTLGN